MRYLLAIGLGLLMMACAIKDQQTTQTSKVATAVTGVPLVSNTIVHPFSNPVKQDTFRIRLVGDSLHIATAILEIVSHDNRLLYTESFTANYLLNYDTPLSPTPAQRDEFITTRIDSFFAESNFKIPAITPEMTFDPNYSDEKVWNELKADKGAIGFYYLLGKEDGRWIAYSKALQKVVMYFNCC